jgi:valyl-tRNA synthetase
MKKEFPKAYEPNEQEKKWYEAWLNEKLYKADVKSDKESYSILMPPPNVTGILHFGHVLNITLQDIYIRWHRMNGYEVCWFPGTDHAGIATQTKLEKVLKEEENITRYDLGREKFIERVWQWREKYGGIILKQLRYLGVSCDWDRTLFTMDESASNAVQQVFIRLFDEGLIYKGKKIINWSPLSQTALSDEEVEHREINEHLYTLKYYFKDEDRYLKVSTVRAETIYGDVAVAVNPKDERFINDIGKTVIVPLVGREVPVIADEHADPEFGTGCVKITPAHDPNDFEVGIRHDLEQINTINPDGTMNELAGDFNGLERFAARKAILRSLKENDLIDKTEDYTHKVGFSQRGGEPVEPYLSDQWYVKMKPLAEIALPPVMNGEIRFFPSHWTKTYEHWLTNVRDWCISRQLWWGHRIPVYYTEDGRYTAAENEVKAREKLGLDQNAILTQEEDVLDTWFSSWLWPMTTMKWLYDGKTEETDDLKKFLPSDLLVTAPDIIFFWVARMIMAAKKFNGVIPFKDVYFTSTIRDGKGAKLSKSLGNSPDPINIIDKYGADAVRFTIIYLSPLGQDVKMDVDVKQQDIPSMEIGRNFANKIWNAGRFLLMKKEITDIKDTCPDCIDRDLRDEEVSFADRWITSRFYSTLKNLQKALINYKVNDYSKILYDFIWRDFCDWYVEIIKTQLNQNESPSYQQALMKRAVAMYEDMLKLLHPVMPFITEEIWHLLDETRTAQESISIQSIPDLIEDMINLETEDKFAFLQSIVDELRSVRSNANIPPQQKLPVVISARSEEEKQFFIEQSEIIKQLAKCSKVDVLINAEKPEKSLASVIRQTELYILLGDSIDIGKEKERLEKEIQRLERNIMGSEKKLSNEKFVSNAPENIVAHERQKLESMKDSLELVKQNLSSLV